MSLHVKSARELAQWQALASAAGLDVPPPCPRRRKRDLRADLQRAIDRAPSDLGRRVLVLALARIDEERQS